MSKWKSARGKNNKTRSLRMRERCAGWLLRLSTKAVSSERVDTFSKCLCKLWYYCGYFFLSSFKLNLFAVAFIDIESGAQECVYVRRVQVYVDFHCGCTTCSAVKTNVSCDDCIKYIPIMCQNIEYEFQKSTLLKKLLASNENAYNHSSNAKCNFYSRF